MHAIMRIAKETSIKIASTQNQQSGPVYDKMPVTHTRSTSSAKAGGREVVKQDGDGDSEAR